MIKPDLKGGCRPLALGYIRVSTQEQVDGGASLDAQEGAVRAEAMRRGWALELVADEGWSARDLRRPGLSAALERLGRGEAHALLATRLDRISRSVVDFASLLKKANIEKWRLVLLSPDLDTADPAGKFTAHVLAAAAEYERDLIGVRTREGMAQRRAEGVHVGRPSVLSESTVERIVRERARGNTLRVIAERLTVDRVATARGGESWSISSVQGVLTSCRGREFAATLP